MSTVIAVVLLVFALGWPLGRYIAAVMRGEPSRLDPLFVPIERVLYRGLGVDPTRGMDWRGYARAFLWSNLALGLIVLGTYMAQGVLPLNPDHIPGMRWDTALHTTISFLTNTDQQHYSGQAQLSYLGQMAGTTTLMVISPMMGLAVLVATLRGLFGGRAAMAAADAGTPIHDATATRDLGNYWVDVIRATLRVLLPLWLVWTLLLGWQGVPATFHAGPQATLLADATTTQHIPLGPVAPMVAVKQLGTNGGGWYGPNSAMALENPTPLSNLFEMLAILLLPVSLVFMTGRFVRRPRLTALVLACMAGMSLLSTASMLWTESGGANTAAPALMEGKEVRFEATTSAAWAAFTTQTSNGSVNAMHDSLAPLTGGMAMVDMLVNAIWGGIGCGLLQFIVYLLLAVFLSGLMTGRTPELFGRKIEAGEVKWLAVLVLLQPIVVLGFTALTLTVPGVADNSNPAYHGISQVFYEYTSAFANNGSGFEGLGDGTPWWNLTASIVLLLGRYPSLLVPLLVAGRLATKHVAPEDTGSLHIETPTFALTLVATIVILTALQFTPVLILGPFADQLSLATH